MATTRRITSGAWIVATALLATTWTSAARADSPLTSCDFHRAYADVPAVAHARQARLDDETIRALDDPDVPHDVRAAIVNAIGWRVSEQTHARRYLRHLSEVHEKSVEDLKLEDLTTEQTFALGYLIAMGDYFELAALGGPGEVQGAGAPELLDAAVERAPKSFAVAMVRALARAQQAMDGDWCDVYVVVREVEVDFRGSTGMRPEAVEIIMDYIRLYRDDCSDDD